MAEDFMMAAVKRVEAQFEKSGVSESWISPLSPVLACAISFNFIPFPFLLFVTLC